MSYYAKIKLSFSSIGGDISLKLPFFLGNIGQEKKENNIPSDVQIKPHSLKIDSNLLEKDETKNETVAQRSTKNHCSDCSYEVNLYEKSSDSSASDLEFKSLEDKQENIVQAQIHERKYLESDM